MTNQEEIQEKGLQRMRRVRFIVGSISIFIAIAVLYRYYEQDNISPKFFPFQMYGCYYAIRITTALIQNYIAKKRGWPAPYGSFWEFF